MVQRKPCASDDAKQQLDCELKLLQNKTGIGYEVTVEWQPDVTGYGAGGRKLAEIVRGNEIFIFSRNLDEAVRLVRHGFLEWILNQHTKPYRQFINTLISLFEELQYERKEKIIDVLTKLLS